MKQYKYIILLSVVLPLTGCNDFLDKVPDNRTVIDSPEAVGELLVTAYPSGTYTMFCEAMSDNAGDKGPQQYLLDDRDNEYAYYWRDVPGIYQETPTFYWNYTYSAIAAANQALAAIEEAGGGPEYDPYRGEALVARAYAHFMLVNIFSLHYNPATAATDLGVPYVDKCENVVLGNYERESVQECYDRIRKDLETGMPLLDDNIYTVPKYHFSIAAANAFASRFYLYIGEWDKAIDCATVALGSNPANILRDWGGAVYQGPYASLETMYGSTEESSNLLLASCISGLGREFILYRHFFTYDKYVDFVRKPMITGTEWYYKMYGSKDWVLNIPKFKDYFKADGLNAETGLAYTMIPLLTGEETLLNRAEAYAMRNKGGDRDKFLADVSTFMSKRVKGYSPITSISKMRTIFGGDPKLEPFYPMSEDQQTMVKCLAFLRQFEFIFEGMRWFDVKRFNIEVVHAPYNHPEQADTLKKGDLRRAVQVPVAAQSYNIVPNPR